VTKQIVIPQSFPWPLGQVLFRGLRIVMLQSFPWLYYATLLPWPLGQFLFQHLSFAFIFFGGVLRGCLPTPSNWRPWNKTWRNACQGKEQGDKMHARFFWWFNSVYWQIL